MKTPETQEEFLAVRDLLEYYIDEIERLETERSLATEAARKQLELILVPYRSQIAGLSKLEYECREALLEAKRDQDTLADAAMELGEPLPEEFTAPGVGFKSTRRLELDEDKLPDIYTRRVPDEDLLVTALENTPTEIPGAKLVYDTQLTFRRNKK